MNTIFVPIECLEERYSQQWFEWFLKSMTKRGVDPIIVGDSKPRKISVGQFLDSIETCQYKAAQMSQIIDMVAKGFEGKILFMDGWFPGIEHLAYLRNNAGKKLELIGILHAGTWDEHDFLSKNGCRSWARHTERGWMEIFDKIIVATGFHKTLIGQGCQLRPEVMQKIVVADFPVYRNGYLASNQKRSDLVVFPHRLAAEKDPCMFESVCDCFVERFGHEFPEARFVRTKDVCKTKDEYYHFMSKAKVAFSSAKQETFGIAMLEAVAMGCWPVAPDRLSYRETLREWNRYETVDDAAELIAMALRNWEPGLADRLRYHDNADAIMAEVFS